MILNLPLRCSPIYSCIVLLATVSFSRIPASAQLPTSFQKVELVTGLKNSVNFEFAPDGRVFIVDRYGEIFIYNPSDQTTVSAGVIDVFHDMEDGLLALEFDPQFLTNQHIFIHYSDPNLPINRVSRFTMNADTLDRASEVEVISWTSDRNGYYHAAGDMAFDSHGNLYIAIGDNTNHTPYAALNESDKNQSAERSSSNSNDLRGKILRIKPNADGTYGIPTGNLFPGGVGGRPEIYVMGARNPFKIFVDKTNTNWLFWGEVGPDANVESQIGPEGMDEINLVKAAGNFGWPYLSGKNEPYLNTYKQPNFYYDHAQPVNHSKWNTGAVVLPSAQPSWLEFFHGCYLAGPRYYYNASITNPKKLPADFHQAFFYYDFNTSKIWVVKMDGSGNILSNQRFAENVITGSGFIDLKIGPDGQLYILEYGVGCCASNVGSGKLLRIDYTGIDTNKPPQVTLNTNKISGPLPLTIDFSSEGTFDLDGDALSYSWDFQSDGIVDSNDQNPTFTYTTKGTFTAILRVTDSQGETVAKSVLIYPGNTASSFVVNAPVDGGMFSWEDDVVYDFDVIDQEDGTTADNSISCDDVGFVPAFGHLSHSHDGLTINQCNGVFNLAPTGHDAQGQDNIYYQFKFTYTDDDGLTTFDQVTIYPKKVEAEFFTAQNNTKLVDNTDDTGGGVYSVRALLDNAYIRIDGRNLENIDSVNYRLASTAGGIIELHADSPSGPLLSTAAIPVTGNLNRWTNVKAAITNPGGKHDLFFVFKNPGAINLLDLNYIEFDGAGISVDNTPPNIYEIKVLSPNTVKIRFNEALQKSSAINVGNYVINNDVKISSVVLGEDLQTIYLFTSPLEIDQANQITISNIRNTSGIAPPSSLIASFTLNAALVRINAGGPLVDVNGVEWLSSRFNSGGAVASKPGLAINNTTSDAIYQSELNGNFTMNIPVPVNGSYDVRLHFAELVYKNVGERVFNVSVENGQYGLLNYDIFSKVGYASAIIESFPNVEVVDGFLNITFTGVANKAKLSAVEVLYGASEANSPSVGIINPQPNLTLTQPFAVTFKVENWWMNVGGAHVRKFIDGIEAGNVYDDKPITIQSLSSGVHTIRLALVGADNVVTEFQDEVQVNIVSPGACISNPFPLQFEEHIIGADLPYRSPQIFAADINGDGYKDIVTGGWWFSNPGSPKGVWTRNVVGSPMNNMFLIHDFDNDGDPDLLGTNGTYLGSQLSWARNDGKGNFTILSNIPTTAGFPVGSANNNTFLAGAAVGNFNGVANVQIALVWNGSETTKAPVKMLTVPADPSNEVWLVDDIAPNAVGESINAIDVDKDGDLDLTQAKNWLRNDNGVWTTFTTGLTMPTYYEHHLTNDLDRNGQLDGVMTQIGDNGDIFWYNVPSDPTEVWTKSVLGTDVDSGVSLDLADLDFDGDLDVITAEWKMEKRLIAFENDLCNSGTWIKHILHPGGTTAPDHHNAAQTADLDNDGDLDIISVGWDKRTPRIYINNSSTSSENGIPIVASPLLDQTATFGVPFLFTFPQATFSDPDGDALVYTAALSSATALPSWLSFTASTRTFQGTPPNGSTNLSVKVTASDNKGGKASDEFTIAFSNAAPVVNIPIPDQLIPANQESQYTFPANAFTDPNGTALAYTAGLSNGNALPAWITFNGATRTFNATPTLENLGTYLVQVTASDGEMSVSDIFQYTVVDPASNQPPVLHQPIPDLAAPVGLPFNFAFSEDTFTDPEGDELNYVATLSNSSPLPSWLAFNPSTRTFSGTPSSSDLGTIEVKIYASDNEGTVEDIFAIMIEPGGSIRINAGGGATTGYGVAFDADKSFLGGSVYTNTILSDIAGTIEDHLYRTERYKAFNYEIPLAPGTYLVRLHFAEIYFGATGGGAGGIGKRIFNVTAEGLSLLSNFDIFAEVGSMRALIKEFELSVTDGKLNLNFEKVVENPKVSAVEVIPLTASSNSSPLVSNALSDQTCMQGQPFGYTFGANTFTDPDGDPLEYNASLTNGNLLPAWLNFSPLDRTFTGNPPAAGQFNVRLSAHDGKGGSAFDDFVITVQQTAQSSSLGINSGGPGHTSTNGIVFSADKHNKGGSVYTNNNITDIAGTTDDVIYKTERYKMSGYDIPLASGSYLLKLHFAEIYFGATGGGAAGPGKRVFGVSVEGITLLDNFDIYAEVGAMTALTKEFNVVVNDGMLNIAFVKIVENPKISAIEIIPAGGARTGPLAASPIQLHDTLSTSEIKHPRLTAYPNPFKRTSTLQFSADGNELISLQMVNLQGVILETVFSGEVEAGRVYEFQFDGTHLHDGLYLARVISKGKTEYVKLVLMKGQ